MTLAGSRLDFLKESPAHFIKVNFTKYLKNGLGSHPSLEDTTALRVELLILVLGEQYSGADGL
jgi:hypothetical protein